LLCVAGVALVLTLVFTWPLAARFGSAGRLDSNDGRFSIWNVAWVARALTSQPSELWNANIFYPSKGTLSYSEANLIAGAIAVPVWLLTKNAVAACNSAIVASFVLSALCMFALVRHLTNRRSAAAFAAILFAFNSYVFSHLPHIQLLMTFGLPLSLLCMHWFVEEPSGRRAGALGLAIGVQALACGYYGIYAALAVGFGLTWFCIVNQLWRSPRFWMLSLIAVAVTLLVISPLLPIYLSVQRSGLDRTLLEAREFSVRWRAYLASGFLVYRWMLPWLGHWREVLFPGVLTMGFALTAVVYGARARKDESAFRRADLWFYVALTVLAVWASLGPDAGLYRFLYHAMPGMSFLRAPSRFGLVAILALAVLASFGLALAERAWAPRRRVAYLTLLALLAITRSTVGPLALRDAPAASAVYARLRDLPRAPTAEFPFYTGAGLPRQTEYMLGSTQHWQPLINGFSDYLPPDFERDLPSLNRFPESEAMDALARRGVKYVVVHWGSYGSGRNELKTRVEAMDLLHKVTEEAGVTLFRLDSFAIGTR
jgi:hypothetical protein